MNEMFTHWELGTLNLVFIRVLWQERLKELGLHILPTCIRSAMIIVHAKTEIKRGIRKKFCEIELFN